MTQEEKQKKLEELAEKERLEDLPEVFAIEEAAREYEPPVPSIYQ